MGRAGWSTCLLEGLACDTEASEAHEASVALVAALLRIVGGFTPRNGAEFWAQNMLAVGVELGRMMEEVGRAGADAALCRVLAMTLPPMPAEDELGVQAASWDECVLAVSQGMLRNITGYWAPKSIL